MTSEESESPPKKKRRLGRKLAWLGGILLALLIWLNGPGWRWIGGLALNKALKSAEMTADFRLEGTLLGGVRVEDLSLKGGMIRKLELGSAGALYDVTRVIRGEVDRISISHLNAIIDLDAAPPKPPEEDTDDSFDPQALGETLRKARKILLSMDLKAADFQFQIVRGDEEIVTLASSDFSHEPGSDEFLLKLGNLAVGGGYAFDKQQTRIAWKEESLSLDRFDVTPRLGIQNLNLGLPKDGDLGADVEVRILQSLLKVDGSLSGATVQLQGEPLDIEEVAKEVAITLPVTATLRALEASIDGFDKSPDQWNATATAEVGDFQYEEWTVESLTLDAAKDNNTGTATWDIVGLDSSLEGEAVLEWNDLSDGSWNDFSAKLKATVPQLSPLFSDLKKRFEFAPAEAPPLPTSSLVVDATVESSSEGIQSADATLSITPSEPIPKFDIAATWTPDGKLDGTFATSGLQSAYALDLTAKTYEANANLLGFRPESLAKWAAAAAVTLPEGMTTDLTWSGSGVFGPEPHSGSFEIPSFEWVRKDTAPLIVRSKGSYAWPENLDLTELTAITEGQQIQAQANLADDVLKITNLEWKDGDRRLVGGQAEIPLPDESKRTASGFLEQTDEFNIFLESEWIDTTALKAWMPEQESPLSNGRARINLVVTGSPASPKINLEVAIENLEVADQPDVPVTDASLSLSGENAKLVLSGEIKPAGYDPVTLAGNMPLNPGAWAEDPDLLFAEEVEARAKIPRLDLATFKKFVPGAEVLEGTLEGFFSVAGTVGKPELAGELNLSNGAIELADSPAPPISNAGLQVRLEGKNVVLRSLSLESAGGTLKGGGTVGLADSANPTFDLSLKGTALPLKRDESMIVRADANLSLRGTMEQAAISGSVDILDSLFYKDIEILPVRMPFTAPSRPNLPSIDPDEGGAGDVPEPFANWTLDVRIRTRDPLLIRGNLATGAAVADLQIGGTLGNIQPRGRAIVNEVEAKLPFSTLNVNNGTVTFTPQSGFDPELNIRGTSTIGRYDVSIFFYGPVSSPKTALTSDPPLPESEIMTLLATGTTSDGLEDGQAATLKAAQLLVEEWRRGRLPFGEQLAKVLSVLNRVDIRIGEDDPLTGKRLNSATMEVTDRILVSSSVDKQGNTRVLGAFVLRFK